MESCVSVLQWRQVFPRRRVTHGPVKPWVGKIHWAVSRANGQGGQLANDHMTPSRGDSCRVTTHRCCGASRGPSHFAMANTKDREAALVKVKEIVDSSPVVVFSKTTCPYCNDVKQLFQQLSARFLVYELDHEKQSNGFHIHEALKSLTGWDTVPNVFIGGKHIGGRDTVMQLMGQAKLEPLLAQANATNETRQNSLPE